MQPDPILYILATAVICASGGFLTAAALASRRIQRAETEGWKHAVRFYAARDKQARQQDR